MTVFNHQDGQPIEVDGAQLYVEQQGNPDGPVLVFLHGGVGDIETFNAITPHLAGHYRLIGIDTRGHGKSTLGTVPLSYERIQRDVQAVLHSLGVPRFTLIGHSDGGIAALRLAAARTPGLERLVTIGAHWALPKDDPTRELYQGITATDWREMFPHSYDSYQALNPEPDFEALVAAVRELWLDTGPDGYPADNVREIEARLLAVRGDEDPLVSRQNALELVERVPGAALLNIPFTDHSPHEDRAQWLLAPLLHFLQVD